MPVIHGKMVEGGRIVIPSALRKELGIAKGDALVMEVLHGELRIRPARAALTRLREKLRAAKPDGVLFVDELIADRRKEAESE